MAMTGHRRAQRNAGLESFGDMIMPRRRLAAQAQRMGVVFNSNTPSLVILQRMNAGFSDLAIPGDDEDEEAWWDKREQERLLNDVWNNEAALARENEQNLVSEDILNPSFERYVDDIDMFDVV